MFIERIVSNCSSFEEFIKRNNRPMRVDRKQYGVDHFAAGLQWLWL